jgi:transcriptional regulator with XRE-family HTH domain
MEIKDRIVEFLKAENISSANFAAEIGVQPSGISHIISGRNKPSLDFIVKMLNRYHSLSTDWLLFGKGKMMKDTIPSNLFSTEGADPLKESPSVSDIFDVGQSHRVKDEFREKLPISNNTNSSVSDIAKDQKVERIIIFYGNNTFKEYFPR